MGMSAWDPALYLTFNRDFAMLEEAERTDSTVRWVQADANAWAPTDSYDVLPAQQCAAEFLSRLLLALSRACGGWADGRTGWRPLARTRARRASLGGGTGTLELATVLPVPGPTLQMSQGGDDDLVLSDPVDDLIGETD